MPRLQLIPCVVMLIWTLTSATAMKLAAPDSSKGPLFIVGADNKLTGPGISLQLRDGSIRTSHDSKATLHINGKPVNAPRLSFNLHTTRKATTAYTSDDDKLLAIWTSTHTLIPKTDFHPGRVDYLGPVPQYGGSRGDLNSQNPTHSPICQQGALHRVLELAVGFDTDFCTQFSDDYERAAAVATAAIVVAGKPFERQACLRVSVVHIDGYCGDANDPYDKVRPHAAEDNFEMLESLKKLWLSPRFVSIKRDAMMFLPGFRHVSYWGQGTVADSCNGNGFAWAQELRVRTIGHELGHIIGCQHSDDGVMRSGAERENTPNMLSERSVYEIDAFLRFDPSAKCIDWEETAGTTQPPTTITTTATTQATGPPMTTTTTRAQTKKRSTTTTTTAPKSSTLQTTTPKTSDATKETPPPGPGREGTCAAPFRNKMGLACVAGNTRLMHVALGHLRLHTSQRNGGVRAAVRRMAPKISKKEGKNHILTMVIVDYSLHLSTSSTLKEKDMPDARAVNPTIISVSKLWNMRDIPMPVGATSCCDRTMHMYILFNVNMVTRYAGQTSSRPHTVFRRFPWKVACATCGVRIELGDGQRRCPNCTS